MKRVVINIIKPYKAVDKGIKGLAPIIPVTNGIKLNQNRKKKFCPNKILSVVSSKLNK